MRHSVQRGFGSGGFYIKLGSPRYARKSRRRRRRRKKKEEDFFNLYKKNLKRHAHNLGSREGGVVTVTSRSIKTQRMNSNKQNLSI